MLQAGPEGRSPLVVIIRIIIIKPDFLIKFNYLIDTSKARYLAALFIKKELKIKNV